MNKTRHHNIDGDKLIANLFAFPDAYEAKGFAYDLLKAFCDRYPLENLKLVLHHHDNKVIRAGIWIASELGQDASLVLEEAVALVKGSDAWIRYYALNVIATTTTAEHMGEFIHVVRCLEDNDANVRERAVRLLATAADGQITATISRLESEEPDSAHLQWIHLFLNDGSLAPPAVEEMIKNSDSLRCHYGVALAERLYEKFPHLLKLVTREAPEELRSLATHLLKIHAIRSG